MESTVLLVAGILSGGLLLAALICFVLSFTRKAPGLRTTALHLAIWAGLALFYALGILGAHDHINGR
jgi:hypothetical protein